MRVRDITEQDIPHLLDYWFNPDNQRYHEKKGPYGAEQIAYLQGQEESYRKQIATPVLERKFTTIVLEHDNRPVGHVHLNDIHNNLSRRIHFHPWIKAIPNRHFGQAFLYWRKAGPMSLKHFFEMYHLNEIIGDVAVNNLMANFCLKKMGCEPDEVVYASYIAAEGFYNRYRFLNK